MPLFAMLFTFEKSESLFASTTARRMAKLAAFVQQNLRFLRHKSNWSWLSPSSFEGLFSSLSFVWRIDKSAWYTGLVDFRQPKASAVRARQGWTGRVVDAGCPEMERIRRSKLLVGNTEHVPPKSVSKTSEIWKNLWKAKKNSELLEWSTS